ncbi:MAG: glycosyltransferase family A protein [Patescibacteria group bacterium]
MAMLIDEIYSNKFVNNRLRYYHSFSKIEHEYEVYTQKSSVTQRAEREEFEKWVVRYKPKIIIITAAKNRLGFLKNQLAKLYAQDFQYLWTWLIVDNYSNDQTRDFFKSISDNRIKLVSYTDKTGYAAPVRNFGISLSIIANQYRCNDKVFAFILDSDDELYDSSSLSTIYKCSTSAKENRPICFSHGYTINNYFNHFGKIERYGTHPHKIDNAFPRVTYMKDIFDYGLVTLSALIPLSILKYILYPDERSFEDNGFAHKLYIAKIRFNLAVRYDNYPINIKRFHQESMASVNDKLSTKSRKKTERIGEHIVKGMRVNIVDNLRLLREYFTQNNL